MPHAPPPPTSEGPARAQAELQRSRRRVAELHTLVGRDRLAAPVSAAGFAAAAAAADGGPGADGHLAVTPALIRRLSLRLRSESATAAAAATVSAAGLSGVAASCPYEGLRRARSGGIYSAVAADAVLSPPMSARAASPSPAWPDGERRPCASPEPAAVDRPAQHVPPPAAAAAGDVIRRPSAIEEEPGPGSPYAVDGGAGGRGGECCGGGASPAAWLADAVAARLLASPGPPAAAAAVASPAGAVSGAALPGRATAGGAVTCSAARGPVAASCCDGV